MRPIVATFPQRGPALALAARLRVDIALPPGSVRTAVVAAHGEPHDGHLLVAAWVPDDREQEVGALVAECGGTLQPQPWTAASSVTINKSPADAIGIGVSAHGAPVAARSYH